MPFTLVAQQYLRAVPSIQSLQFYFIFLNACIISHGVTVTTLIPFVSSFLPPLTMLQCTSLSIKHKISEATVTGVLRASASQVDSLSCRPASARCQGQVREGPGTLPAGLTESFLIKSFTHSCSHPAQATWVPAVQALAWAQWLDLEESGEGSRSQRAGVLGGRSQC